MHEETIAAYFTGETTAEHLNTEALKSIVRHDSIVSSIRITDMDRPFPISRANVIKLCDAAADAELSADALNAIAFALIATDHFEWEDDVISEVLNDWSCPEVNYPLTPPTFRMHRSWLTGDAELPERPALPPKPRTGRIVSQRVKISQQREMIETLNPVSDAHGPLSKFRDPTS